jgi:DNA polymerase III epsilon subunit-like protein
VVVDVEGNGQQPLDLLELAVVPIIGGIIGEPSSWLVKPDTRLPISRARFTASPTAPLSTPPHSTPSNPR